MHSAIGDWQSAIGNPYNLPLRSLILIILLLCLPALAQDAGQTLVVLPFENASAAPGLEWIGESFPEIIGQRLASATSLYVISRDDRLYAFDRLGIPVSARPSRATLIRIAQEMDADYVVFGRYTYDGQTFTAIAQLLTMRSLRLSPEVRESGPLPRLLDIQMALTWDLLRLMEPNQTISRNDFVAASPGVRLDAFEKYMRGVIAPARAEQLRYFREALRITPGYAPALLALGKAQYDARDYAAAAATLGRIPLKEPLAREAQFYLGLSAYYLGEYARAETAFAFVASRLPLTEVFNNLGVVTGRRGSRAALAHFQRAVTADPRDPDYRFNYAVALYKFGDPAAAARQLREALALRPADAEARGFLETVTTTPPPTPPAKPGAPGPRLPLERIKRNYEEASFRQLALEIQNVNEQRMAGADPRDHAAFHVQHGNQMLAQGFLMVAERDFREAILLDPTNAGAHAGLARILESSADPAGARAEARTSLRLQPSAEAFLVLARLDLQDNKVEAARDSVERALQLDPSNSAAQALSGAIAARLAEKAQPRR